MHWTIDCLRIPLRIAKFASILCVSYLHVYHVCIRWDNDTVCPVSYIDASIESEMLLTCAMQDSNPGRPRTAMHESRNVAHKNMLETFGIHHMYIGSIKKQYCM